MKDNELKSLSDTQLEVVRDQLDKRWSLVMRILIGLTVVLFSATVGILFLL